MAIDRVTPASAALTIPERYLREQPGMLHGVPPVARVPGDAPRFSVDPGPADNAGLLADAFDGKFAAPALSTAFSADDPSSRAAITAAMGASLSEALAGDAMQPNQIFLSRQLTWHAPEPSALALSWMAMVRTYAEQRNALQQQAEGRRMPASLFQSDQAARMLREGRLPQQLVAETEAWRFAVYAWGAEKLVLRVVAREADDGAGAADVYGGPGPARRRRKARIGLRLEVHLASLGKVVLQLEPGDDGTAYLSIGAAQRAAMQQVRGLLPDIGAIATRCGVRIGLVRLMRELGAPDASQPTRTQLSRLTPALFRTMAEVAVLLSQPLPAEDTFYEPRALA